MLNQQQRCTFNNQVNVGSNKLTGLSTDVLTNNPSGKNVINSNNYALNNNVLNNSPLNNNVLNNKEFNTNPLSSNVLNRSNFNQNRGLSNCPIVDNPRQRNIDFSVKGIKQSEELPLFRSIMAKLPKITISS